MLCCIPDSTGLKYQQKSWQNSLQQVRKEKLFSLPQRMTENQTLLVSMVVQDTQGWPRSINTAKSPAQPATKATLCSFSWSSLQMCKLIRICCSKYIFYSFCVFYIIVLPVLVVPNLFRDLKTKTVIIVSIGHLKQSAGLFFVTE